MERRGTFDYILLETTGLADPGNIAPLFWLDDGLGSSIYLDGVVTLVDAKNILKTLEDGPDISDKSAAESLAAVTPAFSNLSQQEAPKQSEDDDYRGGQHLTTAHLQISHADVVVINKSDLVSSDELKLVEDRIKAINGLAKVHVTTQSQVPELLGTLLDLHAYEGVTDVERFTEKGHSHLDPVSINLTQVRSNVAMRRLSDE